MLFRLQLGRIGKVFYKKANHHVKKKMTIQSKKKKIQQNV